MTCKCLCTCHQTEKEFLKDLFIGRWRNPGCNLKSDDERLTDLAKEAIRAVEEAIIKLWSDSGWDQACLPRLQDYLKRELLGDDGK